MALAAAKRGDRVLAMDTHLIQPPGAVSPVPTPHPFAGVIDSGLSVDVEIMGRGAATRSSSATNPPPHVPCGGVFVAPPANRGTVRTGSAGVFINGKPAARGGDVAGTCNDPVDLPVGRVVAGGSVYIG